MIGDIRWATDVDPDRNRQFRTLADQDFSGREPADPDLADPAYLEDEHER